MNKQLGKKMNIFAKIFFALTILDSIGLILTGIALFPTFKTIAEYGQLMLVVAGVIVVIMIATLSLEILAKIYLIRGISSNNFLIPKRKGYATVAKLLLVYNLGAVLLSLLSVGGEGATLTNQMRLYWQMLASTVEIVTVFCHLRTRKKLLMNVKEEG